ncbi:MAG: hypothetical protein ACYDAH_13495 [Steroidobacteraceae bacterium]
MARLLWSHPTRQMLSIRLIRASAARGFRLIVTGLGLAGTRRRLCRRLLLGIRWRLCGGRLLGLLLRRRPRRWLRRWLLLRWCLLSGRRWLGRLWRSAGVRRLRGILRRLLLIWLLILSIVLRVLLLVLR